MRTRWFDVKAGFGHDRWIGLRANEVLVRLGRLRQHQRAGHRSPHKPLLVLLALGRLTPSLESLLAADPALLLAAARALIDGHFPAAVAPDTPARPLRSGPAPPSGVAGAVLQA